MLDRVDLQPGDGRRLGLAFWIASALCLMAGVAFPGEIKIMVSRRFEATAVA